MHYRLLLLKCGKTDVVRLLWICDKYQTHALVMWFIGTGENNYMLGKMAAEIQTLFG
jgi:hypothetical protein